VSYSPLISALTKIAIGNFYMLLNPGDDMGSGQMVSAASKMEQAITLAPLRKLKS
jgi:hypothetical protein